MDTSRKLKKPKLRGLHAAQTQFHVTMAVILAATGGYLWKKFVADVRRARYAAFYDGYDAEADFQRMRQLNLFQSCKPSTEE